MPIGIAPVEEKSFTNHIINLQPSDQIYLFSDGYVDQFGGPQERKFRYKPFKDLLLKIHKQNMEQQQKLLERRLLEWKGDLEQVDDILVMGLKIQ